MSFRHGLAVRLLKQNVQRVALAVIDATRPGEAAARAPSDAFLDATQLKTALEHASAFTDGDLELLIAMARAINVEVPGAALKPSQLEWRERQGSTLWGNPSVLGAVEDEGKLYVLHHHVGLSRFDPETNVWAKIGMPPFPGVSDTHGFQEARTAKLGNQLFFHGAKLNGGLQPGSGRLFSYELASGRWSEHAEGRPSTRAAFTEAGGKLFAFGGLESSGWDAQCFDPATGSWRDLPRLPFPRIEASAISVGERIYVIGGQGLEGEQSRSNRIDVFNTVTEKWETAERAITLPRGRLNPSLYVSEGRIHVAAGRTENERSSVSGTTDIIDVSDPSNPTIVPGPDLQMEGAVSAVVVPLTDRLAVVGSIFRHHDSKENKGFLRELAPRHLDAQDIYAPYVLNNTHVTQNVTNNFIQNTVNNLRVNVKNRVNVRVNVSQDPSPELNVHTPKKSVNVLPLPFREEDGHEGFFSASPTSQFFLRTKAEDEELLEVATDDDGKRYLVGHTHAGFGPLPPNREEGLYLYHAESNDLLPIQTDEAGRFVLELPEHVRGEVFLFEESRSGTSAAGRIEVGD